MPILTHPPAAVVRQLLIDIGAGSDRADEPTAAWPVYASSEPDQPDAVITVYDTAGRDQGRLNSDGDALDQPGVQVRVRAGTYAAGYAKASAVRAAVLGVYDRTVAMGDARYLVHALTRVGQVIALGRDVPSASGRKAFTLNATACLKQLE